jgi:hypothetical protein
MNVSIITLSIVIVDSILDRSLEARHKTERIQAAAAIEIAST